MTAFLTSFFRQLHLWPAIAATVDVLVVAFVVYRALLLVKGTRAAQILTGLAAVVASYFLAKVFELATVSWLLDNFINYSIIFLIVIFQRDIRRGLARVGGAIFVSGRQSEASSLVGEVVRAADALAQNRVGALIVIEREVALEEFLRDEGVMVDGMVSKDLLLALFLPEPENVVHDGAVVIKNLRLHRAGCVLPLSSSPELDKNLGTRHRAAIGITEESDAVAVVVSEERGTIALCTAGRIVRDLDVETLRRRLSELLQVRKARDPDGRSGDAARAA